MSISAERINHSRLQVVEDQAALQTLDTDVYGDQMRRAQQLGDRFAKEGMEAYATKLRGETFAARMYLAALAMGAEGGMAVVTIGPPGGGKSQMTEYGYTIVDGIGPQHTAYVPHRQDLTPAELMGKTTQLEKTTKQGDEEFADFITAKVIPIIGPNTKVLQLDEVNRTSPLALNAGLKVMQDGRVEVVSDGQVIKSSDIDLVSLAMNKYGTAHTNKLDPALIARVGMGAFMNERPRDGLTEAALWRIRNPEKRFTSGPFSKAAISLDELHTIRQAIPYVQMQKPAQDELIRLLPRALNYLEDENLIELADSRPADQLVRMAQTFTLLNNQPAVGEDEIHEALTYWMVPRLGMTAHIKRNAQAKILVEAEFNPQSDQ